MNIDNMIPENIDHIDQTEVRTVLFFKLRVCVEP